MIGVLLLLLVLAALWFGTSPKSVCYKPRQPKSLPPGPAPLPPPVGRHTP